MTWRKISKCNEIKNLNVIVNVYAALAPKGGELMKKTEKIEIRVSKEFKDMITNKAKDADMSLSGYVIEVLTHNEIFIIKEGALIAKTLQELRMDMERNGNDNKIQDTIRDLILKINDLIESLPQNRSDSSKETENETVNAVLTDEEDDSEAEEWNEEGDII